jgi:adenine-specific DNA methylase
MRGLLLRDITSAIQKKGKQLVYGKKNEVVNILSTRGNVYIVENKFTRFPVSNKNIQIL